MLTDTLARLLADAYSFEHRRALVSRGAVIDEELWSQLSELGIFSAFVSEEQGGFGGTLLDCGVVMQELGRVLCMEPVIALALAPMRLLAALDLEDMLDAQMSGKSRFALIDGRNLKGDELFTGTVRSVEGAPGATAFLLRTPDDGLAVIDADHPRVKVSAFRMVDGRVAGDIEMDVVPAGLVASNCGEAFDKVKAEIAVVEQWFELGSMLVATESTIGYVSERRQFGKELAQFQTVQTAVAEMAVACEEAKASTTLAAIALDAATDAAQMDRACAGGQLRLSRLCERVASSAVQLHGGMGVSEELPIAAHYRQSVAFRSRNSTAQTARQTMANAVVASGLFASSAIMGGLE